MTPSDNLRSDVAARHVPAWLGALVILVLTGMVYSPALTAPFIWDDAIILTDNLIVKASNGLYYAWFNTSGTDYIPLTMTSFWLEWRLWGSNPLGYRVVNVLLHAGSAILLWRVLLRLKIPGALVAALLFAVHPVCVTSVAWVAERKNTLSLFFYLVSLLLFLKADDQVNKTRGTFHRFHWLSLVCFCLAVFSKQSVVVLPAVLLLAIWWKRGRVQAPDMFRIAPFALVSALGSVLVIWMQHRAMTVEMPHGDSLVTRLLGGAWAGWFYIYKAVWPTSLSIVYPRWRIDAANWLHWVPAVLWVVMVTGMWAKRKRWGGGGLFAVTYVLVALSPVLGFFDMIYFAFSRVGDHLQYIALIGSMALLGAGLHVAGHQIGNIRRWRFGHAGPSIIVLILYWALAFQRATVFASPEALWRDALRKNPDSSAVHYNLACHLDDQGRLDEAVLHFEEAIRHNPLSADAMNNLGYSLHRQGKLAEAETNYRAALRVSPAHADARGNLGALLLQRGDWREARLHLSKAIETRPGMAEAHFNLARALMMEGSFDEAVHRLQATLSINPALEPAQRDMKMLQDLKQRWGGSAVASLNEAAVGLATRKQYVQALFLLQLALQKEEGRGATHRNLASVYLILGKPALAIQHNRQSLDFEPNAARALNNLSWLLVTQPNASQSMREEALSLATRAVRLTREEDPQFLDTQAVCHASLGRFEEALVAATKARALAVAAGQTSLVSKIDQRLVSFKRQEFAVE